MNTPEPAIPSLSNDKLLIKAKGFLSVGWLITCTLSSAIILSNQYPLTTSLDSFYRVSLPTLCLVSGFFTTLISLRLGIISCLFALPLLPDLTWQIQQHLGYGRIFASHAAGLDLIVGMLLGAVLNRIRTGNLRDLTDQFSWVAGAVMIMITVSTTLAISRNLHQTSSPFYLSALTQSLMNLRVIGWHDDYRPLMDWISYASACTLFTILVPTLRRMPDRNEVVIMPLIAGLTIAAIVGVRQSIYGFGLSPGQLNFRLDQFGFMALGFQPDIHAFGGQMLIGAIGLFGYIAYKKSFFWRLVLLAIVVPLCWFALFLSKSKSSLGLAVCITTALAIFWLCRSSTRIRPIVVVLLVITAGVIFSAIIFPESWLVLLTKLMPNFGITDFATLNIKLSYRPEVYWAALKMFSLYPILGLGQGEFYHQAANHALTNSYFLSLEQNGENAHNYFLQVLVENGLVGFWVFVFLVVYPFWKTINKTALAPAWVALAALFAGNVFSHSMLVRENMLIAASLVALMYAWIRSEGNSTNDITTPKLISISKGRFKLLAKAWGVSFLVAAGFIVTILAVREIYTAYSTGPFLVDIQCHKPRPLERDGWTSGHYQINDVPPGARGLTLNLATTQPNIAKYPLPGHFSLFFDEKHVVTQSFVLNHNGPQELSFDFPDNIRTTPDDYRIDLKVDRCFVPKNFGMSLDSRRLGVKIDSVDWHY
jgi:O-antigen ligase